MTTNWVMSSSCGLSVSGVKDSKSFNAIHTFGCLLSENDSLSNILLGTPQRSSGLPFRCFSIEFFNKPSTSYSGVRLHSYRLNLCKESSMIGSSNLELQQFWGPPMCYFQDLQNSFSEPKCLKFKLWTIPCTRIWPKKNFSIFTHKIAEVSIWASYQTCKLHAATVLHTFIGSKTFYLWKLLF